MAWSSYVGPCRASAEATDERSTERHVAVADAHRLCTISQSFNTESNMQLVFKSSK